MVAGARARTRGRRLSSRRCPAARGWLEALAADPAATDVAAIKRIESRTNHDVKAVEIGSAPSLQKRGAAPAQLEWVHFALHLRGHQQSRLRAHAERARATRVLLPMLDAIGARCSIHCAMRHAAVGMLARTHGQTATPTTVGKELANVGRAPASVSGPVSSASSSWAR